MEELPNVVVHDGGWEMIRKSTDDGDWYDIMRVLSEARGQIVTLVFSVVSDKPGDRGARGATLPSKLQQDKLLGLQKLRVGHLAK